MKFAILSDIHGNFPAMQLAVEDALAHGAQEFIFVGDYCISVSWPAQVVSSLQGMENARIVRGNEEHYLRIPEGDDGQFEVTRWCKRVLTDEQRDWLWELPERLDFICEGVEIHAAHSTQTLIGMQIKADPVQSGRLAQRYPDRVVTHDELMQDIRLGVETDDDFRRTRQNLPGGVYIFGHTHIQWHFQTDEHLFINPGSCGLPMDCGMPGAPYTLLTVENGKATVEERRVPYDAQQLVEQMKETEQYREAFVWSEVIFRELPTCREHIAFFLRFAEEYAVKIGDERRPFAKDTWLAAFEAWKQTLTDPLKK